MPIRINRDRLKAILKRPCQVGTRAHQIAEALPWGQWPEE